MDLCSVFSDQSSYLLQHNTVSSTKQKRVTWETLKFTWYFISIKAFGDHKKVYLTFKSNYKKSRYDFTLIERNFGIE